MTRDDGDQKSDIVYPRLLDGALYVEQPTEVDRCRAFLNRLTVAAESPERTLELLRRLIRGGVSRTSGPAHDSPATWRISPAYGEPPEGGGTGWVPHSRRY
ncbi:Scr1 family TA system antitoxin-like transcriptional regulator [Streptomyces sp. ME19-01-6]|uniref:Scr1 family TA system antitoxin-like transcriptional regulator n=1 Tax=Streptomyces sp. ME19-01-6 TaxID=3028686 RepID=UPI0039F62C95